MHKYAICYSVKRLLFSLKIGILLQVIIDYEGYTERSTMWATIIFISVIEYLPHGVLESYICESGGYYHNGGGLKCYNVNHGMLEVIVFFTRVIRSNMHVEVPFYLEWLN